MILLISLLAIVDLFVHYSHLTPAKILLLHLGDPEQLCDYRNPATAHPNFTP